MGRDACARVASSTGQPEFAGLRPAGADIVWDALLAGDPAPPRQAAFRPQALPVLLPAAVVAVDGTAIACAGLGAQAVLDGGFDRIHPDLCTLALAVPLAVAIGLWRGAYRPTALRTAGRQLRAAVPAAIAAWILVLLAAAALGTIRTMDVPWLVGTVGLGIALLALGRTGVALALAGTAGEFLTPRAVVLGSDAHAARLLGFLRQRGGRDLRVIGTLGDPPLGAGAAQAGVRHLGAVEKVFELIERGEVDQVVVTAVWAAGERAKPLLLRLADYPVDVRLAPDPVGYGAPARGRTDIGGMELIHLLDRPLSGWSVLAKAAEDYILATAALAVAGLPMLLIALAVRLDSPGPIIFRQRRIGLNSRCFDVFKFRTMYEHATDHECRRQVIAGDPRVTRVGALLRKASLDELPQIFNVFRGEMSFVGPRPHVPGTRAGNRRFEEVSLRYVARHRVKPGLTGLAQVRGWRGRTETEDKLIGRVESDLEYIERWSVWLDLCIVARTFAAVAAMRNAD